MTESFAEIVHAHAGLGFLVAALSSVFWTLAYALIIRRAAIDRVPGMPLVALGANFAWEMIFLVVTLRHDVFDARLAMLLPWTVLDVVMVAQCYRFGRRDFEDPLVRRWFPLGLTVILGTAGVVLWAFVREFADAIGWYAAFGQNLMMSVLFVAMLLRRQNVEGQSVYIALSKALGTFFAFLLALFWSPPSLHEHWAALLPERYTPISPLIATLYAAIFLFDGVYVVLVVTRSRALGLDPWRRL